MENGTKAQLAGKRIDNASTAAMKRFGAYKPEDEKRTLAPKIEETLATRRIREGWKEYLSSDARLNDQYFIAEMITKGIFYHPQDVEAFSVALTGFQDANDFSSTAGYYLSALVNNCWGREITIHTTQFDKLIDCLGFQNTREVTVKGDLGINAGYEMRSGYLHVTGNVCHRLGDSATGGTIHVEGNAMSTVGVNLAGAAIIIDNDAGDRPGFKMRDGSILIRGDSGKEVGKWMRGGHIDLLGGYDGISKDIIGGEIYHRGARIAKE